MKIRNRYELGPYFTFDPSKGKPLYNWFYYKEAYSPEFVERMINEFSIEGPVLDPFSGIGTTALVCKSANIKAYGIDASPLAVLAGRVKSREYSQEHIEQVRLFMHDVFQQRSNPTIKWDFELFAPSKAFPPANLRDIIHTREAIMKIEDERVHDFLLLALLSILPMCSFILKDGGVLKIAKNQVAPAKDMFKRKVKFMLRDLENPISGPEPEIELGDARSLVYENGSMDAIITSPPYLNNIDYTKVYGLELSLLALDWKSTTEARGRSLRSFVTRETENEKIPEEAAEFGYKIPVAGSYFSDMEQVLQESFRVLKPGSRAIFVVGNAVIRETHIPVDEVLAQIAERMGFQSEIWVGLERIADVRPAKVKTRESALVLNKPE